MRASEDGGLTWLAYREERILRQLMVVVEKWKGRRYKAWLEMANGEWRKSSDHGVALVALCNKRH
jgi:hypothetical protein